MRSAFTPAGCLGWVCRPFLQSFAIRAATHPHSRSRAVGFAAKARREENLCIVSRS